MPIDSNGVMSMTDMIALSSYALATIALAYFALEFIFTGIKDRICKAINIVLRL